MSWSMNLGSVFGTEVRVHFTFLFLLVWIGTIIWIDSGAAAAIDAIIIVLLLFFCVVLHEFGHALVARRFGIKTSHITLWPIGGVASLDAIPEKPGEEIAVALAGPAVNIVLALTMIFIFRANLSLESMKIIGDTSIRLLDRLATVNIVLAVFNLIPAFPMDGGRVLRAALGHFMSYVQATRIAAGVGQVLAILLAFLGLLGNPFLVIIGIFVYLAASTEAHSVNVRDVTRGFAASDAMISRFESLHPDATLSDAADLLLKTTQQEFPVVDAEQTFLGFITRNAVVQALGAEGGDASIARSVTRDAPTQNLRSSVESIIKLLQAPGVPAVAILDNQKRFKGYITYENVVELLMIQEASRQHGPA
jgi:Zn-dependent protease/CBS domain-containing protein